MASLSKLTLGKQSEQAAQVFLQNHGLTLLENNFRCRYGEIDLIMRDRENIVFVEVRTRNSISYGNAFESINQTKINKIIKTAIYYLKKKKWFYKMNSRFDVIAIHPVAGKIQLEWIKNAFSVES